jgi:hypothetical protein
MTVSVLRWIWPVVIGVLTVSCASIPKDRYPACPYDTAWEVALETMKERPLTVQDKERGVIETGWIEMAAKERGFGVFGRQAFDDKERARMNVSLTRVNDAIEVSALETRQRWHLRGGVTQQATKWWPIEPSEEAMTAVMNRLHTKLKDRGCSPA